MTPPPDPLRVIETAYRLDVPKERWLREVAAAIHTEIGAGLGLLAFEYVITEDARLQVGQHCALEMPEVVATQATAAVEQLPPEYVRESFALCSCSTQSQAPSALVREQNKPVREMLATMFGWHDIFIIGGMDPTRHGVYFGAWLPRETALPARVRGMWARVAVHIVAARRLHRRLIGTGGRVADTADALLEVDGRVAHAKGAAEPGEARDALRRAVRAVERARRKMRREDAAVAVSQWKGLVSARWTLIDHFESDGKRYVLARRNDVEMSGLEQLTLRERQALAYAALGHRNLMIAYEMGISPSTVGVLLHRAARKLGATTRQELLARFAALPKYRDQL